MTENIFFTNTNNFFIHFCFSQFICNYSFIGSSRLVTLRVNKPYLLGFYYNLSIINIYILLNVIRKNMLFLIKYCLKTNLMPLLVYEDIIDEVFFINNLYFINVDFYLGR
jgi:hypothetical protein